MKKRPDKSLLNSNYLLTYNSIEACLMQHNFSLLFPRKIENQVFDMVSTAQKQKVPSKKLACNKDLNGFCNNLISEYNKTISKSQKLLESLFSSFLLFSFFSLLDLLFDGGIIISTLVICLLVSIGYILSTEILSHKKNCSSALRKILILSIVLIPFILISLLKNKFEFMLIELSFSVSAILLLLFISITAITYYILSEKYDVFLFIKSK